MRITEIYPAYQGEGMLLGIPMIFVRVGGCNLSCSWCDSAYTWKKGYEYTDMTPESIMEKITQEKWLEKVRWVSITGGEPTIYQDCAILNDYLASRQVQVVVETNGLRNADWLFHPNITVSCSPKLPSSGQDTPSRRLKVAKLIAQRMSMNVLARRTQIKFVIAMPSDLDILPSYCDSIGLPLDDSIPIYLQPDGFLPIDEYINMLRFLQDNAPPFVRVTPQVHRLIHGSNARGV